MYDYILSLAHAKVLKNKHPLYTQKCPKSLRIFHSNNVHGGLYLTLCFLGLGHGSIKNMNFEWNPLFPFDVCYFSKTSVMRNDFPFPRMHGLLDAVLYSQMPCTQCLRFGKYWGRLRDSPLTHSLQTHSQQIGHFPLS